MMARIVLSFAVLVFLGTKVSTQSVTTAPLNQPTMKPSPSMPGRRTTGNSITTPTINPSENPTGPNPTGNPTGSNPTGNPTGTPTEPNLTGDPTEPNPTANSTGSNPTGSPTRPNPTVNTTKPNPSLNPTGNPISTARPNSTDMPTVYTQQPDEIQLEKDNLLETITKLGMEWEITFEFKPENYNQSGYTNILHLSIGEDLTVVGDRIPAIFYHPDSGLHVATAIGNDANSHRDIMPSPPVGKWTSILVSQLKSGSKTTFNVKVDGAAPFSVENPAPKEFSDMKVYAADPWWDAQPGSIRGLTIKTK